MNAPQHRMCYCVETFGRDNYWFSGNKIHLMSSYNSFEIWRSELIYGLYCQNVWFLPDRLAQGFVKCPTDGYFIHLICLFKFLVFFFHKILWLSLFVFFKKREKEMHHICSGGHHISGLINCTFLKVTGRRGLKGCILQVSC